MSLNIFSDVISWYMKNINYFSITLLMAIESSFIPFPSEIVVPPAAYKASNGELNMILVFISATVGALIGAIFNYYFAMIVGRNLLYKLANTRIAHFLLISEETIRKSENFFIKYGVPSTFIGRFIPAIRQLISLPAGLAKMDMRKFLFFTFLGSGLWNVILMLLGVFVYSKREMFEKYYHQLSILFLICGCVFVGYIVYNGLKYKRK
ncbi:MAG: DedA family protein [Chitinispirillaceae bacterium]|nr:DedA family protein [Chitinispirillaceae bacterium]